MRPNSRERQLRCLSKNLKNETIEAFMDDEDTLGPVKNIRSTIESIAAKGFCREQKQYNPPDDVSQQLEKLTKDVFGSNISDQWTETSLSDPQLKYKLLTKCIKVFKHEISNANLYTITTISDVLKFYNTPVQGISPYDELVRSKEKLPENLHVVPDYCRFHPETDTFFGGISAYPASSTIVTGLKARKKYKGYAAKTKWPYV
ncbi:mitochondrial ribosomal protein L50 isoform X2 [Tachypleus tridentatus]|uniref:mitochondrial ribosomal protein L50 isoform X2 n=1 Tax=Tachypleus tridentatus TaxID=6853 RepID=UPI003FD6A35C